MTRMASDVIFISKTVDLLAQVFGCAADHQCGDEDGQDRVQQHAVEAGTDATEDHLAESVSVPGAPVHPSA